MFRGAKIELNLCHYKPLTHECTPSRSTETGHATPQLRCPQEYDKTLSDWAEKAQHLLYSPGDGNILTARVTHARFARIIKQIGLLKAALFH